MADMYGCGQQVGGDMCPTKKQGRVAGTFICAQGDSKLSRL